MRHLLSENYKSESEKLDEKFKDQTDWAGKSLAKFSQSIQEVTATMTGEVIPTIFQAINMLRKKG